ncbi:MAG: phasin, PhaP [Aestuariivita sp.]|nr:phasin, PhaP [Aestuariivita sp.]MCY4201943.1 phasin, PhaP [Aestuariivita sp.]MCY4288829.1 phasin, PhaP [Aestuariivita sp.]MCY4345250.1 phasin, PhaP [Aestuariivita sp.]
MTKSPDFTSIMRDMMGAFPVDTTAMEGAYKTTAALNEKLSAVALSAAEKSAEISNKWTKDTIAKLSEMSKAKEEPADYAKAVADFASASAEVSAENLAAYAEVAKRVQMDTVELMMAAGKDLSEDAATALKKATNEVTAAAKKASAK